MLKAQKFFSFQRSSFGLLLLILNGVFILVYVSYFVHQERKLQDICKNEAMEKIPRHFTVTSVGDKRIPGNEEKQPTNRFLQNVQAQNSQNILPIVIYNRVPKCGSSSMNWMIKQLNSKLNFKLLNINLKNIKHHEDETTQAEMVAFINALPGNTLIIRHLHFLNFTRFNSEWPAYINVIRDPIERYASHYYFVRSGFAADKKAVMSKQNAKINESLDECLEQRRLACITSGPPTMLAYFCGQEQKCRDYKSSYPLEKAKENVKNHFLTIGLTEDFNNTLKILQTLLPSYFTGWQKFSLSKVAARTKTYNRPPLKSQSISLLQDYLKYEIEFYEFVKKRFYIQLAELEIA